jgi:phosphoribosylamine--glycine ligase / phosphoribosylformylglycinamidine cyclo-ligase
VVLASKGYPGAYGKGKLITLGEDTPGKVYRFFAHRQVFTLDADVVVFQAGTSRVGNDVVTAGGRVIAVTAFASTLRHAVQLAYTRIDGIDFEGKTYRKDIAHRCHRFHPAVDRL